MNEEQRAGVGEEVPGRHPEGTIVALVLKALYVKTRHSIACQCGICLQGYEWLYAEQAQEQELSEGGPWQTPEYASLGFSSGSIGSRGAVPLPQCRSLVAAGVRLDVDAERAEEQELEKGGLADTLKEIVARTMPSPRYVRFHEAHVQRYLSRLKAFPPRCGRPGPSKPVVVPSWPAHDAFLQPKLPLSWRRGE